MFTFALLFLSIIAFFSRSALAVDGIVTGFTSPVNIAAGSTVTVTIDFTNIRYSIENDYGIIWGLVPPTYGCTECVGIRLGFTDLYAISGSYEAQRAITLQIPGDVGGNYTLTGAVTGDGFPEGYVNQRFYYQTVLISRRVGPPTYTSSTHRVTPIPLM
ncbi:hypothetical protein M231_04376 [Tremella mesenterica]|uniref:Secreted protein n=1 Tax=Tremella mesenterica TaxID=5217 RepID=A0A4Q1BKP8_TREME|nr:hypothetical protein M231_04376 [Tremella mesenterica]